MENGKLPAFQSSILDMNTTHHGLTKREYFAGLALQAILSSPNLKTDNYEMITIDAVGYADALLKALDKQ